MERRTLAAVALCLFVLTGLWARVKAQHASAFMGSAEDPAIRYSTVSLNNPVVEANRRLEQGMPPLTFEGRTGFLRSALDALQIPKDSQLLVFSRASLQGRRINELNPRALFFNDRVALGWVRGGDVLEVATHDDSAGVVFYTLAQRQDPSGAPPKFKREFICLGCHVTSETLGVPGLLMFSTTRAELPEGSGLPRHIDQDDPLRLRFGGWFVTGSAGSVHHMGNEVAALDGRPTRALASVEGLFDSDGYPSLSSDIVAHFVFTHQTGMVNLLTRAGWEARVAEASLRAPFWADPGQEARVASVMNAVATEVVDYLLFIDEATLTEPIRA
jgi:hypothetical protein